MAEVKLEKKQEKIKRRITKELIYEMRKGSPIYYRDYDKVLSGEKSLEEVMGSGGLQSLLLTVLVSFLYEKIKDRYFILSGEIGYKIGSKSWYNLDIAVISKERLKTIPQGYIEIPPDIVIEIDTKADLRKFLNPQDYFHRKTQDLLDCGVKKVIWIFTKERKVWVAEKGKPWIITDWNDIIEVMDNITLNLYAIFQEKIS
ncbi:MAG: Uma2 family endonuclease [Hydrogenothermaceae bacterium]